MSPIGARTEALDTPALLVDLDVLARNIERMARIIVHEAGVGWRPHTKAMKTPANMLPPRRISMIMQVTLRVLTRASHNTPRVKER